MKRPNWKLDRLMISIELGFVFLCLTGLIMLFLYLFDSTFPIFKYSLLCVNIISGLIIIGVSIGLVVIIKCWRRSLVKYISNFRKLYTASHA